MAAKLFTFREKKILCYVNCLHLLTLSAVVCLRLNRLCVLYSKKYPLDGPF